MFLRTARPEARLSENKIIVCLANSRKHSGRCVAGIELVDGIVGDWIRPVSARSGREVSEHERQYEDGSDPDVLDVISVPVLERIPEEFQTENWLLDPKYYWTPVGRAGWEDLLDLESPVGALWINGYETTHGE